MASIDLQTLFEDACRLTLTSPGSPAAESARNCIASKISDRLKSHCTEAAGDASAVQMEEHLHLHELLRFLEELFSSLLPGAAEVLELIMTDILSDILSCEDVSEQLSLDVRHLMGRMASTCHPRDTLTAFLAQIHSGSDIPWHASFLSLTRSACLQLYKAVWFLAEGHTVHVSELLSESTDIFLCNKWNFG